jgi:hypothetical protein
MRTSAVAALLTTLALSAPALAHGTKTRERLRIVGNTAVADWTFNDGNIGTFVSVVVSENDESGTAGPGETAFVSLSISRYDIESGNVLITGRAEVDGSQNFGFHIDHNLNTATLDVHDAIFQDDNSFTFFNVDMHLVWTASGDPVTMEEKSNDKSPGLRVKSRFKGIFRDAVASGSIFGKNIQFTPVPSSNGQLQFNKFGELTVTTDTP